MDPLERLEFEAALNATLRKHRRDHPELLMDGDGRLFSSALGLEERTSLLEALRGHALDGFPPACPCDPERTTHVGADGTSWSSWTHRPFPPS